MTQLNVIINLEVQLDEISKSCNITHQTVQIQNSSDLPLKMKHIIGAVEKNYGILTLGAKSIIGRILPRNMDITVICDGNSYPAHTHKTSRGRIDRLTSLFSSECIHINSQLNLEYDVNKKNLYVTLP